MGFVMAYYSWTSLQSFESWHAMVKYGLGIPHPNYRNGLLDLDAQWTTDYTTPIVFSESKVVARVEDSVAANFSEGIGEQITAPYPPTPMPTEGMWTWDEESLSWVEVTG